MDSHYNRRPERHIEYFGIETCVPAIEQEHTNSFISFATDEELKDSSKIISSTGYVLNIAYDNLKYLKSKKVKPTLVYQVSKTEHTFL